MSDNGPICGLSFAQMCLAAVVCVHEQDASRPRVLPDPPPKTQIDQLHRMHTIRSIVNNGERGKAGVTRKFG